MDDLMSRLGHISARLSEEAFLANKGLSNEVGIHVFCYDPKDELTVRAHFEQLKAATDTPYRLIEQDLYTILLKIRAMVIKSGYGRSRAMSTLISDKYAAWKAACDEVIK